jgi:hypothetical protein
MIVIGYKFFVWTTSHHKERRLKTETSGEAGEKAGGKKAE